MHAHALSTISQTQHIFILTNSNMCVGACETHTEKWPWCWMSSISQKHACMVLFEEQNGYSVSSQAVHVSACKKCIMFVILWPLFVGKLRALTYAINPNEQAVSRIYGGRMHGWYMITDRSYQRSIHQIIHSSSMLTINMHAAAENKIQSFFKASYHEKRHFHWSFEINEFHILFKNTLTCS